MPKPGYDFTAWATVYDTKCRDGRVISKEAFLGNDGIEVPIVYNHNHSDIKKVLGHAYLENHDYGMYMYGYLNRSEDGEAAKTALQHGDIRHVSIFANDLQEAQNVVQHGNIREVSLVLAGANPGALIDFVISHGAFDDTQAEIYTDEEIELCHAATSDEKEKEKPMPQEETKETKDTKESGQDKTVKDVIDSMNEDQKNVLYMLVGEAMKDKGKDQTTENEGGEKDMSHNIFAGDTYEEQDDVMIHDGLRTIISDARRAGSMKESFLQHAAEYGIDHIDYLFPEHKSLNTPPEFIKRETDWVQKVMGAVHKTPFSRIKSQFADITADEARARGYMKGKRKKEEVFTLLKRTTEPTTIYKKQKIDRDDSIDITDFDVVAWIKSEMRIMLDEEIARAILFGDGRLADSDDKIDESKIRPIAKDDDLFTIKYQVKYSAGATEAAKANQFIDDCVRARKTYKGSGQPTLFTTEDMLTECLLLKDEMGHRLYKTEAELATAMRVKEIITLEIMEQNNEKIVAEGGNPMAGLIVNLSDYNVGADKGGAINMFDDFDIDYNQMKYLIETRCSGALVKPFSAIRLDLVQA